MRALYLDLRRARLTRRTESRSIVSIALRIAAGALSPITWAARRMIGDPRAPEIAAPRRLFAASVGPTSYYEDSCASGLPVVLLHDVDPAGSASDVRVLFDGVRAGRPVLAIDLPGHGFSRRTTRCHRDDYVRWIGEVLTDVARRFGAVPDVVAVGTTGELAARALAGAPRLARSLAIVAPTGFGEPAPAHRGLGLGRAAFAVARHPGAGWVALGDPRIVTDVYATLHVPTCFVHGEASTSVAMAIDMLVMRHPGFRRAAIAGTRKLPHGEDALGTVDALRAFWRSLDTRPQLRIIRGGLGRTRGSLIGESLRRERATARLRGLKEVKRWI